MNINAHKSTAFIIILSAVVLLQSCNKTSVNSSPNAENKSVGDLLAEKKEALKSLELEIKTLEEKLLAENPEMTKSPVLVTVLTLQKSIYTKYVELQGSVQSDEEAYIASEMGGRVTKLNVKEGQYVKKGQWVASVDIESLINQKAEIQKSLDLAIDVFDRQKRLWDQNIGSEIQYLQAKNAVERLQKSMETLQSQMNKGRILAPISGTITSLLIKEGEVSGPGAPMARIINTSNIKVVTDVPENYLQIVKIGQNVAIELPALGQELTSRISLVGKTVDPSNRTFKMESKIPNKDNIIKPNLLASVKIKEQEIPQSIILPINSIQQEVTGRRYVYIASENNNNWVAQKIYITIGESNGDDVIITSGLVEGQRVILKGARNIIDGQLINIQNPS